jgi:SMODS and SLOG-associating 2TM effector domain family 4
MAEIKTGELPASKARDKIIREAKRLEESTLFSFKGHHHAARGWTDRNLWLGIPTVVISAVIGAAAFSQYSKEFPWVGILAGFLAIAVAILSGITTFLNPNDKESSHLIAAHGFDTLNNDSRLFWAIECWQESSDEVLTSKLRELVERKNELNSSSPQIPPWAYKKAKVGIEAGEATFQVDKDQIPTLPAAKPEAAAGN